MLIIAAGTGGCLTRGRSGCERRWRLSCVFIYFNITPQQGNKSSLKHSISFYLCTLLILCKGFIILCTLLTLSYSIILFEKKIPLLLSDSIHFLFIFLGGCFLFYHTNFWQNVYYLSLYQWYFSILKFIFTYCKIITNSIAF